MPATAEEDCPARDGCDTTDDDGGERLNRRAFRFQRLEFVRQLLHMALLAAISVSTLLISSVTRKSRLKSRWRMDNCSTVARARPIQHPLCAAARLPKQRGQIENLCGVKRLRRVPNRVPSMWLACNRRRQFAKGRRIGCAGRCQVDWFVLNGRPDECAAGAQHHNATGCPVR